MNVKIGRLPKLMVAAVHCCRILVRNYNCRFKSRKTLKLILSITLTLGLVCAHLDTHAQSPTLPKVYLIGEHEESYLGLSQQYPANFLAVFNNNIDLAYTTWSACLLDMEDLATRLNFDLKGVKLWMNLYFNADGTIAHMAFYPKPNSRNVPNEHLVAFFKTFVKDYELPVSALKGFQHSTSVSFPTIMQRDAPLAKRN
jgi:hypothetical protein